MGYKFRPVQYIRPKTIQETTRTLQKYGKDARIIAGGTDLLAKRPKGAKVLLDINALGLNYVRESEGARAKRERGLAYPMIGIWDG